MIRSKNQIRTGDADKTNSGRGRYRTMKRRSKHMTRQQNMMGIGSQVVRLTILHTALKNTSSPFMSLIAVATVEILHINF